MVELSTNLPVFFAAASNLSCKTLLIILAGSFKFNAILYKPARKNGGV